MIFTINTIRYGRKSHRSVDADELVQALQGIYNRLHALETQMAEVAPQARRAASFTNVIGGGFDINTKRFTETFMKNLRGTESSC